MRYEKSKHFIGSERSKAAKSTKGQKVLHRDSGAESRHFEQAYIAYRPLFLRWYYIDTCKSSMILHIPYTYIGTITKVSQKYIDIYITDRVRLRCGVRTLKLGAPESPVLVDETPYIHLPIHRKLHRFYNPVYIYVYYGNTMWIIDTAGRIG